MTMPNTKTYDAFFKTAEKLYINAAEAAADVKVCEYDYFGNVTADVTADSEITYTTDGENIMIDIKYGSFTKTLNCKINTKYADRKFVYEENFDTVAEGSLPDGWTLYSNKDKAKTTAAVGNGALYLKNTEWYGDEWLLFDNLANVKRMGLSIEGDITLAEETINSQRNNSCAGFGYMAETNGDRVTGSWAALRTDLQDTEISNPDAQRGYIVDAGKTMGQLTFTEKEILALNKNNQTPTHFKIVFEDDTHTPTVYLNNQEVTYEKAASDTNTTRGKVGLYIKNASVKIDNIKVTGEKPELVEENYLTVDSVSYDAANKKLNATVSAGVTDTETAKSGIILMAVYGTDNALISVKTTRIDLSNIKDIQTAITAEGVEIQPAADKVKVFFWNEDNLKPLANSVQR